ncbi:MAG: hypothetical protein ABR555_00710 [Pyrinomonadaceae bacterium]
MSDLPVRLEAPNVVGTSHADGAIVEKTWTSQIGAALEMRAQMDIRLNRQKVRAL